MQNIQVGYVCVCVFFFISLPVYISVFQEGMEEWELEISVINVVNTCTFNRYVLNFIKCRVSELKYFTYYSEGQNREKEGREEGKEEGGEGKGG